MIDRLLGPLTTYIPMLTSPTMSSRLKRIVANLLRHVPDPPKPVARPTASFVGLKVGQQLTDNEGLVVVVVATDSQGAAISTGQRIEDRNWKASWSRVRAPRKPRKETK